MLRETTTNVPVDVSEGLAWEPKVEVVLPALQVRSSVFICGHSSSVFAISMAASAQMSDFTGYKDPALFTRLPPYFLTAEDSVVDKAFDA
jgi:hypothetical protein